MTGSLDKIVDCNDKICVVPWHVTGGGALASFHIENAQTEVTSKSTLHLLQAHRSPLTSYALCDLDASLLATAARDAVIKVQNAPKRCEFVAGRAIEICENPVLIVRCVVRYRFRLADVAHQ